MRTIEAELDWPPPIETSLGETLFVGIWHPELAIGLTSDSHPSGSEFTVARGRNWALIGSKIPGQETTLVHGGLSNAEENTGLAFRGYILAPSLHSWSGASVAKYWENPPDEHNGVFSAAIIDRGGRRLRLVSDAFAIAPLYFRQSPEGAIIFATSARYLGQCGDRPNPIAERTFYQRRALCGDISLTPATHRVGPGATIEFSTGEIKRTQWFDYESLPPGDRELNLEGLRNIESAFQAGISRCLDVMPASPVKLPLSGGEDSRRILAALVSRGVDFDALTVRVLKQCGDHTKDLDGPIAQQLASKFNFRHQLFDLALGDQYKLHASECRRLLNWELTEHAWLAPMISSIDSKPALLFDGLAGDILGNTERYLLKYAGISEKQRLTAIVNDSITDVASTRISEANWISIDSARHALKQYLEILRPDDNCGVLAMILSRCARGTGLWGHHLLPVGVVPVFPYLDLDYVRTALTYQRSADASTETWQSTCLANYWPEFYSIPSTRRIPDGWPKKPTTLNDKMSAIQLYGLLEECNGTSKIRIAKRLAARSYAPYLFACQFQQIALRCQWWLQPLLILESFSMNIHSTWKIRALSC